MQFSFKQLVTQGAIGSMFIVWFLLFPFDANILPVSLGFMTIYPELILTFILLLCLVFAKKSEPIPLLEKLTLFFFFIWGLYGFAYLPFVNNKAIAFYEIRSLIMMAVTISMLFLARYVWGKKKFFELSYRLALFIFIVLTIIAFAEHFTGIHFKGTFTGKLWNLTPGNTTYSAVFLYDNQNTFLCYLFGFALIIFLTEDKKLSYKTGLLIIAVLWFFSFLSDSQLGKLSVAVLLIAQTANFFSVRKPAFKKYYLWVLIVAGSLAYCLLTKEIYYGPLWKDREHYLINSISPVEVKKDTLLFTTTDSLLKDFKEETIIKSYRSYQAKQHEGSISIRSHLIKNGLFLTKQSNFMGVGPGQFSWYHDNHKVPFPTSTVNSAHNGPIEIISQYGVLIFISYLLLFIYYGFRKVRQNNFKITEIVNVFAFYTVFVFISCMSSAFLILNIGWMLTAYLLLSSTKEKNV